MTVAETHGKISGTGSNLSDRMEDLLASDVFGCLRYLPPGRALLPFLGAARSFSGEPIQLPDDVTRLHTAFWPWLNLQGRAACEPDVVLGFEAKGGALHVVISNIAPYQPGKRGLKLYLRDTLRHPAEGHRPSAHPLISSLPDCLLDKDGLCEGIRRGDSAAACGCCRTRLARHDQRGVVPVRPLAHRGVVVAGLVVAQQPQREHSVRRTDAALSIGQHVLVGRHSDG